MRWYAAHAYTPNETPVHGGGCHAVLLEDFRSGRIRRQKGDVLCRPSHKFWGLHGVEKGRAVTCKGCKALLARFGLPLVSSEDIIPPACPQTPPTVYEGTHPTITLEEALGRIFRRGSSI